MNYFELHTVVNEIVTEVNTQLGIALNSYIGTVQEVNEQIQFVNYDKTKTSYPCIAIVYPANGLEYSEIRETQCREVKFNLFIAAEQLPTDQTSKAVIFYQLKQIKTAFFEKALKNNKLLAPIERSYNVVFEERPEQVDLNNNLVNCLYIKNVKFRIYKNINNKII